MTIYASEFQFARWVDNPCIWFSLTTDKEPVTQTDIQKIPIWLFIHVLQLGMFFCKHVLSHRRFYPWPSVRLRGGTMRPPSKEPKEQRSEQKQPQNASAVREGITVQESKKDWSPNGFFKVFPMDLKARYCRVACEEDAWRKKSNRSAHYSILLPPPLR